VRAGDVLLELRTEDEQRLPAARDLAGGAVTIADAAPAPAPLILERVG